jgi:AcrR family transcriptional regulator
MKTDTKRAYHHGNLKEDAVLTALDMVEKEGPDAITLRELAGRIGASRTAIYRHFESKEALIQAVITAGFERFDAYFADFFSAEEPDILSRFSKMGRAYLSFATENPQLYRLLFGEKAQQEREEVCDFADIDRPSGFNALVRLIETGQRQQLFREGDTFVMAAAVWSMIHGLSSLIIDGHLAICDNVEAIYGTTIDILLEGLRKKG